MVPYCHAPPGGLITTEEINMAGTPLKLIRDFFGMNMNEMKAEWTQGGLTEKDKEQIIAGLQDGTLNY